LSAAGGFDIHYSIFDTYSPPEEDSLFQSFFSDLTGFFSPAAALTPETKIYSGIGVDLPMHNGDKS